MKKVIIHGDSVAAMADIHRILAEELNFPEWYGGNLDALHDCLTELSEEVHITVLQPETLLETLGSGYTRLCRVLSDSAEDNPYLTLSL
jgi:ribonuclease inhibitor